VRNSGHTGCQTPPGAFSGEDKIVERFVEKPEHEQLSFLSLGIYAFRKDALIESLAGADQTRHDIVFDILMPLIAESQVRAYIFDDYWADVGWLSQYYDASMVLLMRPPPLNLGSRTMPIYTRTETRPPTLAGKNAEIGRCLIANGCTIEGAVSGSILFPGVKLKSGSVVEDSIIFADTVIEQDATVRSSIIDREARIGREAFVGFGNPTCPNSTYPSVVDSGLTIVGKRTQIPEGIRIGRNCLIGNHLAAETIPNRDIVCGETITGETKWQKTLS
jgi:glucose-1-phosphate adenylyltransferase